MISRTHGILLLTVIIFIIMGGSSIEKDNVLINGQCVFGYFHGMQSEPVYVKIDYPKDWLAGTALKLDDRWIL